MVEDLIRGFGWVVLKVLTVGRYRSTGSSAELFEGTCGLLAIAAIMWSAYRWVM